MNNPITREHFLQISQGITKRYPYIEVNRTKLNNVEMRLRWTIYFQIVASTTSQQQQQQQQQQQESFEKQYPLIPTDTPVSPYPTVPTDDLPAIAYPYKDLLA